MQQLTFNDVYDAWTDLTDAGANVPMFVRVPGGVNLPVTNVQPLWERKNLEDPNSDRLIGFVLVAEKP